MPQNPASQEQPGTRGGEGVAGPLRFLSLSACTPSPPAGPHAELSHQGPAGKSHCVGCVTVSDHGPGSPWRPPPPPASFLPSGKLLGDLSQGESGPASLPKPAQCPHLQALPHHSQRDCPSEVNRPMSLTSLAPDALKCWSAFTMDSSGLGCSGPAHLSS